MTWQPLLPAHCGEDGELGGAAFLLNTTQRFWNFVNKGEGTSCWLWTGAVNDQGYGTFHVGTQWPGKNVKRTARAHKFAYELIQPVPKGLVLDHLCKTKICVNPNHLEPVTSLENMRRGPGNRLRERRHCTNGHPFDLFNTYYRKDCGRRCRTCQRDYVRPANKE